MKRLVLVVVLLAGCGGSSSGGMGGGNGSGGGQGVGGGSATGGGTGGTGGAGPSIDRESLSGTRLKNRYLQGDDGSKMFVGFFDTMRSETCAFAPASDGHQRCLPFDSAIGEGGYFADSACTQKIALGQPGCTVRYAYEQGATCPTTFDFFAANVHTGPIYANSVNCAVTTAPAGYTLYQVGAHVDPSSFVSGTFMNE